MFSLKSKLLQWFPILGKVHRLLHATGNTAKYYVTVLKKGFNHVKFDILWEARIQRFARHTTRQHSPKPVIHLYTVCWNEERIAPYFMDYYSQFVDAFYIYDNMSSDSTVERVSRYKNVTVIPFDTKGTFDEATLLQIRNKEWKQSRGRADFAIVCDMDEFLYHPELMSLLHLLKRHSFTLVKPCGYNMVSEHLPEFDGVHSITQLINTGIDAKKNYSKSILFSPVLKEINFSPGCHKCAPVGPVKQFQSSRLKLLHYKFVDRELILQKTRECQARLSETNKRHGWSRHYVKTDEQVQSEFDDFMAAREKVI